MEDKIKVRVEALIREMTLEEKLGQMMQLDGRGDFRATIRKHQPGSLLHINGASLAEAIGEAQGTRLGIPLLFADDGIHGHSFYPGATIFPTQLALACTWNPDLVEEMARATAREMVSTGVRWTFSPVCCLARDLRWGRVGETFGEDPHLIGELAAAMIRGYQGSSLEDPDSILATAKHYAGYSETQGGRDASEADLSKRKLRSYFLPPFQRAKEAGCRAFMTGYQSMEGVPSTANRWLLREVLKEEWDFNGIVVTDWDNVGRLVWEQQICATLSEAAVLAIRAGNDLMMSTPGFAEAAAEAVRDGHLGIEEIDAVCRRLLTLKFRLGLFENPGWPDSLKEKSVLACVAHRQTNLEAARQSIVLLINNGLLPLNPNQPRTLAIIGPNADDDLSQLGDWSLGSGQMAVPGADKHPRSCTQTAFDGLRDLLQPLGWKVLHVPGCAIDSDALEGLAEAKITAQQADLLVAVIGDSLPFIGEGKSTATLELQGGQIQLLNLLRETGKPLIVVLINSKPLVLPPAALQADAIVEAFNPGMRGGQALAEILFGLHEPSGRLPISFPRHAGQQPVHYSQVRGQHGNRYADLTQEPLFPFGHGLTYTRFAYADFRCLTPTIGLHETATFTVTISNVGERPGVEVVQFYLHDPVASVTWVNRQLKDFRRISLNPGQSQTVVFQLAAQDCWLIDAEARQVVEPGEFTALCGPTSRESDLLRATFRIQA